MSSRYYFVRSTSGLNLFINCKKNKISIFKIDFVNFFLHCSKENCVLSYMSIHFYEILILTKVNQYIGL